MPRFHRRRPSGRGFTPCGHILFILLPLMAMPVFAAPTVNNADYVKARSQAARMAEGLNSYDLTGTLQMTNNVKGQTGGQSVTAVMAAAARWPDRLLSTQTGDMFTLNLGSGPDESWFYLGQLGNAYVGAPARLTRDLAGAGDMDLTAEKIFNFYGGLGPFLLENDLQVSPQTGAANVVVNGREIPCLVFKTIGPGVIEGDQPTEGPRTLYFDPVSGLVLKSEMTVYLQRNGVDYEQNVSFSLTDFELNGEVDDDRFAFTAPTGTRIVDSLDRLTNPDAMTNQKAPDITLTDLDGNSFQLWDLRGQPVFIDFWATWCPPCKMEMPHIEKLFHELGRDDGNTVGRITIIAASSEDPATIRKFLRRTPYSFRIVTVNDQQAHTMFNTTSIPAGFVIDAKGVIRAHMVGAQTEKQLRAAFAKVGVK